MAATDSLPSPHLGANPTTRGRRGGTRASDLREPRHPIRALVPNRSPEPAYEPASPPRPARGRGAEGVGESCRGESKAKRLGEPFSLRTNRTLALRECPLVKQSRVARSASLTFLTRLSSSSVA